MFRNVWYDHRSQEIHLWTFNDEGLRVEEIYPYKPFLYIEDSNGTDGISIFNNKLKKITFESTKKRKLFLEANSQVYYNLPIEQQFLIEKYNGLNNDPNFNINQIRIAYIDIETYSKNGFPEPLEAKDPINLITLYDSVYKIYYTFGLEKDYYTTRTDVIYESFQYEEELIKAFLRKFRKLKVDILTSWNGNGFDIPYLCHRMNKLFNDEEYCSRFSPVKNFFVMKDVHRRIADYDEIYNFAGLTQLDYQYVYKVFCKDPRESYSLDNIGETELGVGKVAYNAASLSTLADTDWHKFVDYNIQDVELLVRLEEKLQYLQTCIDIGYASLSPFSYAVSTVGIITGMVAQQALKENKIISTYVNRDNSTFIGGYCKEPQAGLHKSILYYDANSLYPNTMITLNISPETKIGKIIDQTDSDITIRTIKNKEITMTKEKFNSIVTEEKIAISSQNVLFSQKKKGLLPEIIDKYYAERVEIKKELKKLKKELADLENS